MSAMKPAAINRRLLTLAALTVLGVAPAFSAARENQAKPPLATRHAVDFARDIKPIFEARCYACHGPDKQKSQLRLDRKADAFKGGDSHAPDIISGKGAESPLIRFVSGADKDLVMPPKGERLSAGEITLLRAWIDQGANWPDDGSGLSAQHWAWLPVKRPSVPAAANRPAAPTNPIDAFLLEKLTVQGLGFSPLADPRTLIRRLYFTAVGLPPTPEQVAAFQRDCQAAGQRSATARLVDQLLASPHFGERWGRHWLDVVRFAESNGFETNGARKNAWPYRDWVIRAFNADLPYDRFIAEQLAGDSFGADEATGFIVGGATDVVRSPDPVLTANQRADELNDFAATTASAFLGLTLHCARCHNHKFDPILMTDYYSVVACFAGVRHGERPLKAEDHGQQEAKLAALRRELAPLEQALAKFDPVAHVGRTIIVPPDDPKHAQQLLPSKGPVAKYPDGLQRGQSGDTGTALRLPTLGKGYLYWDQVSGRDVFAWSPQVNGRFRVWLSWGAGHKTHAEDARYVLDLDGDLSTTADQLEIARANHRKLADGTGSVPETRQWSGFLDAGVQELNPRSKVLLRGGSKANYVSADLVVFQEDSRGSKPVQPRLRLPVTRGRNVDRFPAVEARFVRFTIGETTQLEPCIDELEVFTEEAAPRNVAFASLGAKATASSTLPGYAIHKLEHLNDGLYGNERSWISKERGKGWVQLELAKSERIDRVVWSRDRDNVPRYNDRLATRYRIEVSQDAVSWQTVATADDRMAFGTKVPGGVIYATEGVSPDEAGRLAGLLARRKKLEADITSASSFPMVYAGKFVKPGDTFLMHRGDPMQPREQIAPGALAAFGPPISLAADSSEQERRLALAKWIGSPQNPLTARVIVNRLWHYHFGTGLVDTPSDLGLNGGRPSHPELIDWLASELISSGWKLKHIHRLILNSAAFSQAGKDATKTPGLATQGNALDSANRLLWHFAARRLEAEPLRDAMLAVSGKLDPTMGGPGFDLFQANSNYVKVYNSRTDFGPAEFRRMVYQSKPRTELDNTFGAFDCPDAGQVSPKRTSSTTPLQALNLLNSPFAVQQAQFFAGRVEREAGPGTDQQVKRAFQLIFTRAPAADELSASLELIRQHGLSALCRALFNTSEFLTVF